MKGLIFTLYGNYNYGNKLQNYAVQVLLKRKGVSVETLAWRRKTKWQPSAVIKKVIKRLIPKYRTQLKYEKARDLAFIEFDKKIQKTSSYSLNSYELVIEGSDQVWNPYYTNNEMLEKISNWDRGKVISFSASIAISKIPDEFYELYKYHFSRVNNISVREEQGKRLISQITGRKDVEVLLDPTMLMDISEWNDIAKKPKMFDDSKIVFCYFLGKISDTRKKIIENLARARSAKIIYVMDKNCEYYTCGPSEFVYLESHAELVCTDSFHSSVFALLYSRPLLVFDREDSDAKMSSRLYTLLKKFHLEDHWFHGQKTIEEAEITNQKQIEEILVSERKKADDFLNRAINGER